MNANTHDEPKAERRSERSSQWGHCSVRGLFVIVSCLVVQCLIGILFALPLYFPLEPGTMSVSTTRRLPPKNSPGHRLVLSESSELTL